MKKMIKKLKAQAGESIAEVLIALLISSVALVMLASMISSTQSMVSKSKTKMSAYYQANNALETCSGTSASASVSMTGGAAVITAPIPNVLLYTNSEFGNNNTVYAYYK